MKKKKLMKQIAKLDMRLCEAFNIQIKMQHRITRLESALLEIENPFLNIGPNGELLPAEPITAPAAIHDHDVVPARMTHGSATLASIRKQMKQRAADAEKDFAKASEFLKQAAEKGPVDDVEASKITADTIAAIQQEPLQIAQRRRALDLSSPDDGPKLPIRTEPLRIGDN